MTAVWIGMKRIDRERSIEFESWYFPRIGREQNRGYIWKQDNIRSILSGLMDTFRWTRGELWGIHVYGHWMWSGVCLFIRVFAPMLSAIICIMDCASACHVDCLHEWPFTVNTWLSSWTIVLREASMWHTVCIWGSNAHVLLVRNERNKYIDYSIE